LVIIHQPTVARRLAFAEMAVIKRHNAQGVDPAKYGSQISLVMARDGSTSSEKIASTSSVYAPNTSVRWGQRAPGRSNRMRLSSVCPPHATPAEHEPPLAGFWRRLAENQTSSSTQMFRVADAVARR